MLALLEGKFSHVQKHCSFRFYLIFLGCWIYFGSLSWSSNLIFVNFSKIDWSKWLETYWLLGLLSEATFCMYWKAVFVSVVSISQVTTVHEYLFISWDGQCLPFLAPPGFIVYTKLRWFSCIKDLTSTVVTFIVGVGKLALKFGLSFCRNGQLSTVLPHFALLSFGIVQVRAISMKELTFGRWDAHYME